jgi:hypothetical protein
MKVLLVTPPLVQLNTPYPATAYLLGFLRQHQARLGLELAQADAGLELVLAVLTRDFLGRARAQLRARARSARARASMPASVANFLAHDEAYLATVEPVVRFLQGRDPTLASRIADRAWLPEGPRFAHLSPPPGVGDDTHDDSGDAEPDAQLAWAFGALGTTEQAQATWRVCTWTIWSTCHPRRHRPALRAVALWRASGDRARPPSSRSTPRCRRADAGGHSPGGHHPRARRGAPAGPARPVGAVPGNLYAALRVAQAAIRAGADGSAWCSAAAT